VVLEPLAGYSGGPLGNEILRYHLVLLPVVSEEVGQGPRVQQEDLESGIPVEPCEPSFDQATVRDLQHPPLVLILAE
jgi:hypothetical protein